MSSGDTFEVDFSEVRPIAVTFGFVIQPGRVAYANRVGGSNIERIQIKHLRATLGRSMNRIDQALIKSMHAAISRNLFDDYGNPVTLGTFIGA